MSTALCTSLLTCVGVGWYMFALEMHSLQVEEGLGPPLSNLLTTSIVTMFSNLFLKLLHLFPSHSSSIVFS